MIFIQKRNVIVLVLLLFLRSTLLKSLGGTGQGSCPHWRGWDGEAVMVRIDVRDPE